MERAERIGAFRFARKPPACCNNGFACWKLTTTHWRFRQRAQLPEVLRLLFVIAYHVGLRFAPNCRPESPPGRVPETVIMKITGHRTRSVFGRYNITDEIDTQEAGR